MEGQSATQLRDSLLAVDPLNKVGATNAAQPGTRMSCCPIRVCPISHASDEGFSYLVAVLGHQPCSFRPLLPSPPPIWVAATDQARMDAPPLPSRKH